METRPGVLGETDRAAEPPRSRVLVVEDDVSLAELYAQVLALEGWVVRTAPTAVEAWRTLESETFDVVLTDVMLPGGLTGLELAERLSAGRPRTTCVVMTAREESGVRDAALRAGASAFLVKPFRLSHLVDVLNATQTGH